MKKIIVLRNLFPFFTQNRTISMNKTYFDHNVDIITGSQEILLNYGCSTLANTLNRE